MADAKYDLLTKVEDYDKKAAEQLADAITEAAELSRRMSYIEELVRENRKLHKFVWTTADGKCIAIHNIEDDHLKNIMTHLISRGRSIPKPIRAEALSRGLEVPTSQYAQVDGGPIARLAARAGLLGDENIAKEVDYPVYDGESY